MPLNQLDLYKVLSSHRLQNKYILWTLGDECPDTGSASVEAKHLIAASELEYEEISLAEESNRYKRVLMSGLAHDTGYLQLPNIYIGPRCIGGTNELRIYLMR